MNYFEKKIRDSEPMGNTQMIRKSANRAFMLEKTGELVQFNSLTGWLMVLDEDNFWVDKYKPIINNDGVVIDYEDYYGSTNRLNL